MRVQVAGTITALFKVTNSVDDLVSDLTVKAIVEPGEVSNRSEVQAVLDATTTLFAGGDAVVRILARDEFDNDIARLVQPPLLDIFALGATAERSEQAIPTFILQQIEGELEVALIEPLNCLMLCLPS